MYRVGRSQIALTYRSPAVPALDTICSGRCLSNHGNASTVVTLASRTQAAASAARRVRQRGRVRAETVAVSSARTAGTYLTRAANVKSTRADRNPRTRWRVGDARASTPASISISMNPSLWPLPTSSSSTSGFHAKSNKPTERAAPAEPKSGSRRHSNIMHTRTTMLPRNL